MAFRFSEWLTCPACEGTDPGASAGADTDTDGGTETDGDTDADTDTDADADANTTTDATASVGIMIHRAEVVLECYACGRVDEFVLGEDVPFQTTSPTDLPNDAQEGPTD